MAYIPTQATLTVGGRVFTDLTNLITLIATPNSGGRHSTFRKEGSGSSTGYTPSGAKKFRVAAVRVISQSSTGTVFQLCQMDTDIGALVATAFSNPIYMGMESSVANDAAATLAAYGAITEFNPNFVINNGKYMGIDGATIEMSVRVYGYEE